MKKILIGVAAVIVLVILVMVFSRTSDEQTANATGAEEENVVKPILVEVAKAATGTIATYITETGITAPMQYVVVSSEVSGRITELNKEVGDFLSENDLIAQIDDELSKLALDKAKADQINTVATYEKAKKDLDRYKVLLEKEEISEGEYEEFRLQYEKARSANLSAASAVKTAERQLRNTRIVSPFTGRIAEKYVQEGDMVSVSTRVVKVVDISKIRIKINVSERDVVKMSKGSYATVEVDAFPGMQFQGTVYTISPEGNSETHTFPVEITMPNSQEYPLRSGMIARVIFSSEIMENSLIIPRDAIIERFGKYIVYVIDDSKAVEREISLGIGQEDNVQVLSGIKENEQVVVVGQYSLENGSPVKIKN